MAGWEQSDESDESDGEPCPFCGGLGHSVDDCPMRRDTKGEVDKEQRPDPVARFVDVVADAVLDTADENLSNFLAQLAANGLRAQRYNDLVAALVPGICADAAFDPEMLASKFEVDPEGLLLLRETVRREVDKLRATHALHKDDLTGNLSPEQLSCVLFRESLGRRRCEGDAAAAAAAAHRRPPGPGHPRLRGPHGRRRRRRRPRRGLRAVAERPRRLARARPARRRRVVRAPRARARGGRRQW